MLGDVEVEVDVVDMGMITDVDMERVSLLNTVESVRGDQKKEEVLVVFGGGFRV